MQTPNIDPALYQELQGVEPQQGGQQPQQQQGQQQVQPQGGQQPMAGQHIIDGQLQQKPQVQPQMQQDIDPIEEAKRALGLEEQEKIIEEMRRKMMELEAEKARAQLSAKYPNVPAELVEEEIKKVEAVNPALAEAMRTKPEAMEIAYKAALASIEPKEKPDNITEGEGGGEGGDGSLEEAIKKGEADEATLGEWILKGA